MDDKKCTVYSSEKGKSEQMKKIEFGELRIGEKARKFESCM